MILLMESSNAISDESAPDLPDAVPDVAVVLLCWASTLDVEVAPTVGEFVVAAVVAEESADPWHPSAAQHTISLITSVSPWYGPAGRLSWRVSCSFLKA
jgi:hypothetical protein